MQQLSIIAVGLHPAETEHIKQLGFKDITETQKLPQVFTSHTILLYAITNSLEEWFDYLKTTPNCLTILVGDSHEIQDIAQALKMGTTDYLLRPFNQDYLKFKFQKFTHLFPNHHEEMTTKPHLLIVEDEIDNQQLLQAFLGQEFTITLASSAKEAKEKVSDRTQIMLIDVGLPDQNGLNLLKEIYPHYPDIIGIIMTAFSDENVLNEIYKSPARDFLAKPFLSQDLKKTLRNAARLIGKKWKD